MFKRDDWMFGLLSVGVGAVALWAVDELAGVKTMDPAGPAAMPRIVAWIMIGIGLLHIGGSLLVLRQAATGETAQKKKKNNVPVILICLAGLVYYLFLERVGYLLMTPFLILAVMASVGERNLKKMLATAVGTALLLFCVFHFGLGVNMPLGVLAPLFE